MARDAAHVGLMAADERIANVDGAPWIRNQLEFHGTVDHIGLDFYHFSEHAHTARRKRYGEDDAEGSAWVRNSCTAPNTRAIHRLGNWLSTAGLQPPARAAPRWIGSWATCPNGVR